jgi:hypothetical protein
MRFFLGVGKYTPNAALCGEMAWEPPIVRQWGCLANDWARLSALDNGRLNKYKYKYKLLLSIKQENLAFSFHIHITVQ